MSDNFTNISLSTETLDIYYVRRSILKAIEKTMPEFNGELLDIGCGKMPYKDYILKNSTVHNYVGLDIEAAIIYDETIRPDLIWDGITMPCDTNSFDCALGTEVLEHCPYPDIVLSEVYRVLKPGGVFIFTVPFLWNLHEVPNDEYRYTPFSLGRHLHEVGFTSIELFPTGGWHASLAQMLGLWVMRAPISIRGRQILRKVLKPLISYLIKIDETTKIDFTEGQMITGMYGIAKKINNE
jgi:SAM-dependent methyltransferase